MTDQVMQQPETATEEAEGTVVATGDNEAKAEVNPLDELKDIDFLLEDIEDKIAPLALRLTA